MNKISKIIACSIMLCLVLCSCSAETPQSKRAIELYFTNSSHDSLTSETAYIDEASFSGTKKLIDAVMTKLFDGPSNPEHKPIIPEGVTLRGFSQSKTDYGTINIDLGGDFYQNESDTRLASDELLARYSIICTLCQFENIRKVKFYVNGEDLRSNGGEGDIVQPMGSDNIFMNSPSGVETQTEKFVTLYFTDKQGEKLYPETRKATMADSSLEKTIINELIKGPLSEELEPTLPRTVELASLETTEEVCFVNLTSASLSKLDSDGVRMKTAVYSIVNSLTRIAGIEKVQILIDGKKPETDKYQLFSSPLERNQNIIEENHIS
ncbi:MAG: GerMN domain-containing protein [Clostridia bacterium]|nr:GerMN domain-containing protein [Clostridia bacterium]